MPRSVWKGPFLEPALFRRWKQVIREKDPKKRRLLQKVTLWSRRSVILPQLVGFKVQVHNGRTFLPLTLSEEMVGHKLGEFAPTRVRALHKGKTK
jgi:small subunit ribosomal protein S19